MSFEEAFSFLTAEELQKQVPSAFTEIAAPIASDKEYQIISTLKMIKRLESFGWRPHSVKQMKSKKPENKGFEKHYIRFRNPAHFVGTKEQVDMIPELILANSYSARCSFKLFMGLHRVVSESNLIFDTERSEALPFVFISHDSSAYPSDYHLPDRAGKYIINFLEPDVDTIAQSGPMVIGFIDKLRSIILHREQQKEFAREAIAARWDYTWPTTGYEELLKADRFEDEGNDLWVVYNRVQQKIIKGGWKGSGNRAIKQFTNPDREFRTSTKLFCIAEEFCSKLSKK